MTSSSTSILAALAAARARVEIAKRGTNWQKQPRVPAGKPNGGEWTGSAAPAPTKAPVAAHERVSSQPAKKPVTPPTTSATAATGSDAHAAAAAAVSAREREALQNYTGAMFRDLNPRLRAGKGAAAEDRADLKHIDAAFARSSTKADMSLYRGVSGDFLDKLTPGASFKDGAFTSATSDEKAARNFMRGERGKTALMEIRVPKGSKAISVRDLSQFGKSEQEILLNRGGTFRVVGRQNSTRTRPTKIIVEYVNA